MCEPKICENTSPSSVARHALVEEEEQDLPLSLSEGELFMEPGLRDIECRIRAVEQRCNFKVASQRRITAMLQLLVEDHARLMDMLPASQCASKKLRCSSLPVQPRAGTNSSAKSLRAEEGNRLLMDSQPPPPRPPRRSTTTFPMKVLPEGEPEVMGCKTSGSRGEALSVKEVLARQAAQAAQLSSHAFGDHLPLLLRAPDSPCGLCCFKLWRGLLALCGAAALWDSPRTERAQRCRHFLHVAATLVLAMFAIAIGLLRFVSLVPQEVEPLRDFTSNATFTTDIVLGLAAPLCLNFLGGVKPGVYARRTERVRESCRYLYALLKDNELLEEWQEIVGRDLVGLTSVWFLICTLRVASTLLHETSRASVACMVGFVVFASVLTAVGFVLIATWRGLGLRVQRFTDPFREKEVNLAVVQGEWRELGACMRSMSHALQVCIVVLALAVGTGLIAVAFDVLSDGFALTMLPAVLFLALLTATLFPAALASSACSRFPSFVAIYDPGPEMAEQFIQFADFVAMTDCGCFLWDTKLTAGLLQRAMSITIALAAGIYRSGVGSW